MFLEIGELAEVVSFVIIICVIVYIFNNNFSSITTLYFWTAFIIFYCIAKIATDKDDIHYENGMYNITKTKSFNTGTLKKYKLLAETNPKDSIYITIKIDALECEDDNQTCKKDFHFSKSFNISKDIDEKVDTNSFDTLSIHETLSGSNIGVYKSQTEPNFFISITPNDGYIFGTITIDATSTSRFEIKIE